MPARRHGSRAVVVGASMAGLCAARVLAERFGEVVVLDRDALPAEPAFRRGVPQARHAHALLLAGEQRLERWFPGLGAELLAHGALPLDRGGQIHWFQGGGLRMPTRGAPPSVLCSRPMLEHHVRGRVAGLPNVTVRRAVAEGPIPASGGRAVAGVRLGGGGELPCDLLVDASGRGARGPRWLEQLGFAPPPVSEVRMDMGYASRLLRRRPDDRRGWLLGVVLGGPPRPRFGVAFALEEDRWMVTLAGFHDDHPPTDEHGWRDFAGSLPDPAIAELIAGNPPLTEVVPHRMVASQRRHVERLREVPGGLVLLGDAVASFNPIYGQGMSSAALQAEALGSALDGCDGLGPDFVRRYHRLAGRAVATPWRLSVGGDFAHPLTTGPRPRGSRVIGRYLRHVVATTHRDEVVAHRVVQVTNLVRPPAALLAPPIAARVLRARWAGGPVPRLSRSGSPGRWGRSTARA